MPITPGENVGPYRVIEQLGSGGMATVYKAYHPSLDRYVAIKVLHPAFKADPQFFERFQREARIVAKLEHPHIIPIYDFSEHHGEPYLVMRFVEGDTLKLAMDDGPLPPAEVLRLMRPVCEALAYAHQQGVLHRDIKPSNIMVTTEGGVFLTDFGLARMVQAGESTLSQDTMLGTPQYISPEQAQGVSELDGRTDIYSLGVVLFEMLTGRVPFTADTPFATVHDHIYAPLPLPSSINPEIDPAVERLLLKTLAKNPDDRFATATDLLKALETTLASSPGKQSTAAKISRRSPTRAASRHKEVLPTWVWAGSIILAVCLVAGILIGLLWLRRANRPLPPPGQPAPAQLAGHSNLPLPPPENTPAPHGQPPLAGQPAAAPLPSPAATGLPQPQENGDTHGSVSGPAVELTGQAARAMQQRQFQEAIRLYRQALEVDAHYLPAYFGLSEALKQSGDAVGSLTTLEEAVANNPGNPAAYLRLGEAYLTGDNPTAALTAFEQAAALAPETAGPYARQALALMALDKPAEAKAAIDQALALDQRSPEAHLAQAMYLIKQGDRPGARQELQQLLRDRTAPPFLLERAQVMLNRLGN